MHFFLKRRVSNLSDAEVTRLNSWALGLRVLALLPLPSQQRCSALHEHPHLILEVLLMMKQLQSAALVHYSGSFSFDAEAFCADSIFFI